MKLYYSPGACSLAPHVVAREAGLSIELIKVDIPTKKTERGDDYWAVNPKGYVPALVLDSGEVLTEVAVICQYLADQKPESGLVPASGMARYHQQEALNFVSAEIHKPLGALFNPMLTPEMREVHKKAVVARRLVALEKLLTAAPYLGGERYSAADAYLFTVLRWAFFHQVDLAPYPHVAAFFERTSQRPKIKEALAAEGLQ